MAINIAEIYQVAPLYRILTPVAVSAQALGIAFINTIKAFSFKITILQINAIIISDIKYGIAIPLNLLMQNCNAYFPAFSVRYSFLKTLFTIKKPDTMKKNQTAINPKYSLNKRLIRVFSLIKR